MTVIPLVIAGKHRDKVAIWELPFAGQIIAVSQVVGIAVPCMFAPGMDLLIDLLFSGDDVFNFISAALILISIFPVIPQV